MGQEISATRFDEETFSEFARRVARENDLLAAMVRDGGLRSAQRRVGFELEGWLIDADGRPAPRNVDFLAALDDACVVPELAQFNFELNSYPRDLGPTAFDALSEELDARWLHCQQVSAELDMRALMIGILPTVRPADLSLRCISPMQRYRALNEQVLRLRGGAPLHLAIDGRHSLRHVHGDVMLESAATSFQLHLQLDVADAGSAMNLAKMISAPMVAVSANAPFLFGRELWEETRIPLFEQAVEVGHGEHNKRVTFGTRYVNSVLEYFDANRSLYPVLLPELMDEPEEKLAHLRLHNGTIWRWNRPLIGFGDDGRAHVRLEHRVIPAGPSPADVIANAAFFTGLMTSMLNDPQDAEARLPFATARANFYLAAREGLRARVFWLDGRQGDVGELLRTRLLPQAEAGLMECGLSAPGARRCLLPLLRRVATGQTGAAWQRRWVADHGPDFAGLVDAYHARQQSGRFVAEWDV